MTQPMHMPKMRLEDLIALLWREGFTVLGPRAHDGSVAFGEVRGLADLPVGMRESQEPGRYRLTQGLAGEVFGVVNGAGSLKPFFFALKKRCSRSGGRNEDSPSMRRRRWRCD